MQKVTKFLEKNVEWLFLGLAGLWVLWIAWAYVMTPPVTVQVNNDVQTPATADEAIRIETEKLLAPKLVEAREVPPMPVPSFAEEFAQSMSPKEVPELALTASAVGGGPIINSLMAGAQDGPDAAKVKGLAEVPAPVLGTPLADRDQVVLPDDPNQMVARPGVPVQLAANGVREDRYWVTIPAKFDENELAASFQKVNLPADLQRRDYLAVELERQEWKGTDAQGNDVWGEAVVVPPLKPHQAPVKRDQDVAGFMNWALRQENQPRIVQPVFYQTVSKPWMPPVKAAQAATPVEAQPRTPQVTDAASAYNQMKALPPGEQHRFRMTLDADMRRQLTAYENEMEAKERAARPRPQEPPKRSSRRGGSGMAQDPNLMRELYAQVGGDPGFESEIGGPAENFPERFGVGGFPGGDPATAGPVAQPGAKPQVLDIWAHDETVEPGKTYRYRMRVVLRNPVYNTRNIVEDPALTKIAELPADKDKGWSEWTEQVRIPDRMEFFVQSGSPGNNNAKFNIFRWQNGKYNLTTTQNLQPGDMVGTTQPDAAQPGQTVDYTTGWSVVDVRSHEATRDVLVLLMDKNGQVSTRYMKSDQNSPKKKDLEFEMQRRQGQAAVR